MRRLRLRHPAFPRDSVANPLELTFPSLFPRLQDGGGVKVLVVPVPSWVCFFPPLPWVKALTANQWGDEEGISASRARARRTRLAPVSCSQPETKPKSYHCAAVCSSDRGVSLLRVESELEIPVRSEGVEASPES
jgi:hypothetical protein